MKITIKVTDDHIIRGLAAPKGECEANPVAFAINDHLNSSVVSSVGLIPVLVDSERQWDVKYQFEIPWPRFALDFELWLDNFWEGDDEITPFEFKLEIPEQYLKL